MKADCRLWWSILGGGEVLLIVYNLVIVTLIQQCAQVSAFRMSIAHNSTTTNTHGWYRQPLPMWRRPSQRASPSRLHWKAQLAQTSYKVFYLRFLSDQQIRCNDGTQAGLVFLECMRFTLSANFYSALILTIYF